MKIIINADCEHLPDQSQDVFLSPGFYLNVLRTIYSQSEIMPLAALLSQYHALDGQWYLISPVNWQAGHNNAFITAAGDQLLLDEQESRQWFESISAYLSEVGCRMVYHDTSHWLLSKDKLPTIAAKPLDQVCHQPMMDDLMHLDEAHYWAGFLTEMQMFCSANPLNEARMAADKAPVNGVWVWGQGDLMPAPLKLSVSADLLSLVKPCLLSVENYQGNESLKSLDCLILNHPGELSPTHQQAVRHIKDCHWLWNNKNYRLKRKSWWKRIREKCDAYQTAGNQ